MRTISHFYVGLILCRPNFFAGWHGKGIMEFDTPVHTITNSKLNKQKTGKKYISMTTGAKHLADHFFKQRTNGPRHKRTAIHQK